MNQTSFQRHALLIAALLLGASSLAGAADLTIEVADVKTSDGSLMVALYNAAGDFLKAPVNSASARAAAGVTTVLIKDLPPGDYAFAIYHDANANGKMDRNLMGIPSEDYAFSNNAIGKMGPPTFDGARFAVPAAGATARVSLK